MLNSNDKFVGILERTPEHIRYGVCNMLDYIDFYQNYKEEFYIDTLIKVWEDLPIDNYWRNALPEFYEISILIGLVKDGDRSNFNRLKEVFLELLQFINTHNFMKSGEITLK